jgi:hypothetical protein
MRRREGESREWRNKYNGEVLSMFGFFSKKKDLKFEEFDCFKIHPPKLYTKDELRQFSICDTLPSHDVAADLWLKFANVHVGALVKNGYDVEYVMEEGVDTFFLLSSKCGAPEITGKLSREVKACIFGRIALTYYSGYDLQTDICKSAWRAHNNVFNEKDESIYNFHVELNNALKRNSYMRCRNNKYPALFGITNNDEYVWVSENENLELKALVMTSRKTWKIEYALFDTKETADAIYKQIEQYKQELFSATSKTAKTKKKKIPPRPIFQAPGDEKADPENGEI